MSFLPLHPKKYKPNEREDEEESHTSVLSKHIVMMSPLAKPHMSVFGKVGCQTRVVSGDESAYFLTGFQVFAENMKSWPS